MKAALLHGRRDLRVEEVPEPEAGPGEVLLRVSAAGICGTDVAEYSTGPHTFAVHERHPVTGHVGPVIIGHEFAGRVVAVGPGVEGFSEGELVVCGAGVSCGRCERCLEGRTNLCERYYTLGQQRHGGMAEYVAAPVSAIVSAAPHDLTDDAATLGQPMSIAVHSMRVGGLRADDEAVVIGAGGIGAFLTFAAASRGAPVTVVDVDPDRLAQAERLGAERVVLADRESPAADQLRDAGVRPDVVFEVSGTAVGLRGALASVRSGGRVVLVGVQEQGGQFDLASVTLREVSLLGPLANVCKVDLPEALRLLALRREPWSDIAPEALPLERLVEDALEPHSQGRPPHIKTLLDPWVEEARPTGMDAAHA